MIHRKRFPHGLTLAEVAMALFIIGIGVLSIATVYLQNAHAVSNTAMQATAHRLAADLAERIRKFPESDVRFENAIGVRCGAASSARASTAQARAMNEVACWQEQVVAALPSGTGSVTLDESTVPPTYAITVSWSQTGGGLASYTIRAAPLAMTATPRAAREAN